MKFFRLQALIHFPVGMFEHPSFGHPTLQVDRRRHPQGPSLTRPPVAWPNAAARCCARRTNDILQPCPCCGGHMIVLETFQRLRQPRAAPDGIAQSGTITPLRGTARPHRDPKALCSGSVAARAGDLANRAGAYLKHRPWTPATLHLVREGWVPTRRSVCHKPWHPPQNGAKTEMPIVSTCRPRLPALEDIVRLPVSDILHSSGHSASLPAYR